MPTFLVLKSDGKQTFSIKHISEVTLQAFIDSRPANHVLYEATILGEDPSDSQTFTDLEKSKLNIKFGQWLSETFKEKATEYGLYVNHTDSKWLIGVIRDFLSLLEQGQIEVAKTELISINTALGSNEPRFPQAMRTILGNQINRHLSQFDYTNHNQ